MKRSGICALGVALASLLLFSSHSLADPVTSPLDAISSQRLANLYGAPVSVDVARRVAAAAIAEGKKNGWAVAVAVVDPGGVLVYFERVDGTQSASCELAIEKARTAAAYKRSTRVLEDRIVEGRLQYLRQTGALPIEGGIPLLVDGKVVGAVGVSGVRSEQDGACAKAAVEALSASVSDSGPPPGGTAQTGSIAGRVRLSGGGTPASGKAAFFRDGAGPPPRPEKYLRPPDEVVALKDGAFTANLAEGTYFLSVTVKETGELIGPPVEGDYVFPSPTELENGRTQYSVQGGIRTDIGTVEAVPYRRVTSADGRDEVTGLEGTVTDKEGRPVPGALVLAFPSPDLTGRPLFVSERSGTDGKYSLRVSQGGTFYVKARTFSARTFDRGGYPEDEEIIGIYGTDRPLPVVVRTNEVLKGIDVKSKVFSNYGKGSGKKKPSSDNP